MSKEPEMSDELTKLAEIRETLSSSDRMLWNMGYTTVAPVVDHVTKAIAALDALILTPPVDPLLIEAREWFVKDHVEGWDIYWDGVMCKHGAANEAIRSGKFDSQPQIQRYVALLRRGLELRTVADGGGA